MSVGRSSSSGARGWPRSPNISMNHWLLWKSVPASSPQLFPVHCAGCRACFNFPGLSGHFNHHQVLNKEPRVPLGQNTQKRLLGTAGRRQGRAGSVGVTQEQHGLSHWLPTPSCLLVSALRGCFCGFLLKITPAPPWRVVEGSSSWSWMRHKFTCSSWTQGELRFLISG